VAAPKKTSGRKNGSQRIGRRKLTPSDYQRLAEFRYVLRHFLIFSEEAAAAAGLAAQQHQALLAVKAFGRVAPVTTGDLAERLGIRHHSAVGLVDRLVEKALVKRRRDALDRRQVLIELTPKAETVLERLTAIHRSELRRLAPLLRDLLSDFDER
jgi:DNA-binding MarR family transcriptional regulator